MNDLASGSRFIPNTCIITGVLIWCLLVVSVVVTAIRQSGNMSQIIFSAGLVGGAGLLPSMWTTWALALLVNTFSPARRERFRPMLQSQWLGFLVLTAGIVLWSLIPD